MKRLIHLKISKTFSILIVIIVSGIFLLPNIIASVNLFVLEREFGYHSENSTLSLLSELGIEDEELLGCMKDEVESVLGRPHFNAKAKDLVSFVDRLVCKGMNIKSLKGIEEMRNLIYLDLSDNPLTDISPLLVLPELSTLHLDNVRLNDNKVLFYLNGIEVVSFPNMSDEYCADIRKWTKHSSVKVVRSVDDDFDCKGSQKNKEMVEIILTKIELGYEITLEEEILALEYKINREKELYNTKYGK